MGAYTVSVVGGFLYFEVISSFVGVHLFN